jgi:nitric oxide reductase subunit B
MIGRLPWFTQAMNWREISGWCFSAGYILLVWDLLTIGKRETRPVVPAFA